MQQLAALNPSSIIATPIASITPSSGKCQSTTKAVYIKYSYSRSCWIYLSICNCRSAVGTNTPPAIAATPVPALPPPIALNSYPQISAPPNGQSVSETLYTNGIHPYQGDDSSSSLYSLLYYIVELHEKSYFKCDHDFCFS